MNGPASRLQSPSPQPSPYQMTPGEFANAPAPEPGRFCRLPGRPAFRKLSFVMSIETTQRRLEPGRYWIWGATLAAVCVVGCSSPRPHRHGAMPLDAEQGRAAAQPPSFLAGPAALLLTNAQDYTAQLVLSSSNGAVTNAAGALFQKEGHLLFVPRSEELLERNTWAGSFRFLWDASRNSGYIISEPLHGYAAVEPAVHYSILAAQPPVGSPVSDQVDGQPCWMEEVNVHSSAGENTRFRRWRPEALATPPVRVLETSQGSAPGYTLQLSEVNVDALSPELFSLPAGFTRYDSAEAMVRQLMRKTPVLPYTHSEGTRQRR
jgi:hypothetical protein